MRNGVSVVLAVLLVLSSVGPAVATGQQPAAVDTGHDVAPQRDDPDEDVIGWEGGYWHNESIDVDQSDGLSDEEIDAYVARAMARVEYLRQEEFDSEVPVEILTREEFQQQSSENRTTNATYDAWNNQVWEALFIVGETENANSELSSATGQSTAGFYAPGDNRIRIITDSPDNPTIDNATLVHELVHALQDQNGQLDERLSAGDTQDGSLAADSVFEGEANYIEKRYADRCGVEWECVGTPSDGGSTAAPPNLGILLTLLFPYSDGPVYIDQMLKRGGWSAVEAAIEHPPDSTEQVIHRTDEEPTPIEFQDRARGDWETFPNMGENGSDTVGEASMYVMFWYQARNARADTIPVRSVVQTTNPYDLYNYDSEPSAGWGNDRIFPYQKTADGETQHGYVWVTEWDTERDAAQFVEAYRAILSAQDARQRDDGLYVIPDGEFADAFRIDRDGTRVTIVNGPTPEAVGEIRPTDETGGEDADGSTATDSGESADGTEASATDGDSEDDDSTGLEGPGFGPLTAVLALVAALALAGLARRRD